ncbi:M16 family metallopeptidase [Chlorogloea sp. CCALA 695]|uniref:M16 family metallopeptidase n=1 Tax=Chlorogloea sp. CCALA 695 TaxID=2107693 RepID=UPI000D0570F5|nr:pitrilysin family protein [Chlorogloea sp. CCALA 695]PSB31694.1 peptidase M16 [Chlorogloea sp. CCALA 695]
MTLTAVKPPRLNSPTLHRLPNGLTIVAEQMPVEAVNLSLWVNVGSANEPDNINGMAHFLEHMVFKGTKRIVSGEFERRIEERGAVTNAATSQDYTHYYITTAPKDFASLAPLQIDVVLNSLIPDDAFSREKLVVLEEIRRSDDNPRRRTFAQAMQTAFDRLPYRRPVLGEFDVISQLQPQQMRDFHTSWYQPNSITAVAVGNLPVDELIKIVSDGFTESTNPLPVINHPPLANTLKEEPAFTEIVRHELKDDSLQQARLVMVWRVPGLSNLQETYALDVLAAILGSGRTSRLVRDLREEKGLVSSISVSNITQRLQGTFYISATLPVENLAQVETAIAQHINTIQTQPVEEWEIARIRTQVANRFIFANETPSDRAGLYGYYQSMVGNLEPAFDYPSRIQALDVSVMQSAAQKYLSPNAYGAVILKP